MSSDAVGSAAAAGGVFVLGDVSQPPTTPPLAALAVNLDGHGQGVIAGIAVILTLRRRGLGRRLLTDAITLLQADGVRSLEATATPGAVVAPLLRSAGFAPDPWYRVESGGRFGREL